jgi:hypothetical protein
MTNDCNESGMAGLGAAPGSAAIPEWFKVSESENGHVWGRRDGWEWDTCLICMTIRRRDRKNGPCKGAHKLRSLLPPNDQGER